MLPSRLESQVSSLEINNGWFDLAGGREDAARAAPKLRLDRCAQFPRSPNKS